jgi:signal transduction histidine kinase
MSRLPADPNDAPGDSGISEFLLRACHDLRTPLRTILTYSELLGKNDGALPSGEPDRRLGFIVESARRANRLVDGLADYAIALQTDAREFQTTPMDAMLRIVLAKLDKELRASQAEVTYDSMPSVLGHADRLVQLFEHLLRNALRHRGAAAPRVHIAAEIQAGAWRRFAVRDNGPGIDAEDLERIFMPFEILDAKEPAGPGLGLAVCRAIVERHGGKIWAESEPGGGACFWFTLPA